MPSFRFRLAPVLRYRERVREEKRWELRSLEEARSKLLCEVDQLKELLSRQSQTWEQGELGSSAEIRLYGELIQGMVQRIEARQKLLALLEGKLEERRAEILEADRKVKILKRLRQRLWTKHHVRETRCQQRFLDEVGRRKYLDGGEKKIPPE